MKALRISSSAVPLISCTLRGAVLPPMRQPGLVRGIPPNKPNEMPLLLGWQFQHITVYIFVLNIFPERKESKVSWTVRQIFGVESKFYKPKVSHLTEVEGIIGQMMSSHLAAMRVLPGAWRSKWTFGTSQVFLKNLFPPKKSYSFKPRPSSFLPFGFFEMP